MLMVASNKRGRPPKGGEYYDCGRRKPDKHDKSNLVYRRSVDHWLRFGDNPLHSFEAGRLVMAGDLTSRQFETVGMIAKIYGEFERHKGRRRSTASPGYARAFGDPNAGEDGLNSDELEHLERRIKMATKRFLDLQTIIDGLPVNAAKARDVLERLCVEDRMIENCHLASTRSLLDIIRRKLARKGGKEPSEPNPIAITARQPPRRSVPVPSAQPIARPDMGREAFLHVMKMQGHDENEARTAWNDFLALKDRAQFRRDKLV